MKTKFWAIALMLICTVFTSAAQLLYKSGVASLEFNLMSILTNYPIILGVIFYGIGAVLVIIALRGGEVSVLYPIVTSSYIWVSVASMYLFNEVINSIRWAGIFLIISGIVILKIGDSYGN